MRRANMRLSTRLAVGLGTVLGVLVLLELRAARPPAPLNNELRAVPPASRSVEKLPVPVQIPRILHQTWKTDVVPAELQPFVKSWRTHNPGWRYMFWNDSAALALVKRDYAWFAPTFERFPMGVERADILRCMRLPARPLAALPLACDPPPARDWSLMAGAVCGWGGGQVRAAAQVWGRLC